MQNRRIAAARAEGGRRDPGEQVPEVRMQGQAEPEPDGMGPVRAAGRRPSARPEDPPCDWQGSRSNEGEPGAGLEPAPQHWEDTTMQAYAEQHGLPAPDRDGGQDGRDHRDDRRNRDDDDDTRSTMTTEIRPAARAGAPRNYVAQQGSAPIAAATDGMDRPDHDAQQIFISTVVADVGERDAPRAAPCSTGARSGGAKR